MKYALYNGFGLLFNLVGIYFWIEGGSQHLHTETCLGIIIFIFGLLLHTHWFMPLCHLVAAVFYIVGLYGGFNWQEDDRAIMIISAMIIHWRFWLIAVVTMKFGEWLSNRN